METEVGVELSPPGMGHVAEEDIAGFIQAEPLRGHDRRPQDQTPAPIGLGDGGAHYGMICDASYPTFALTHGTRNRPGAKVPLETMVRFLTRDPAEAVCLLDRGLLAEGYRADLNVIDFDRLELHYPEVRYDLPAGGRRIAQRATGYRATIVSGTVTRGDDGATGQFPGRL